MPLFSVIVPMYNTEKYAKKCIKSILSQSYTDFELILVDDGATDSTPQIIDNYAEKDSRVIVIHKQNGGVTSARKAGGAIARGDFLIFVDGDDWLHSECLAKFADIIVANPEVELFSACLFYESPDGTFKEHRPYKTEGYCDKKYLEENIYPYFSSFPQSLCAKALKKNLYLQFQQKVPDCIILGEDESVIIPMLYSLQAMYILPHCLYYYRYNSTSMTKNRRKEWSTEGLLARVKLFEESFDLTKYNLNNQLIAYVAHATINQCLSYFKVNSYKVAKDKTKNLLDNGLIDKYIRKNVSISNKKECLAKFALKHRLYFMIKLYSLFW